MPVHCICNLLLVAFCWAVVIAYDLRCNPCSAKMSYLLSFAVIRSSSMDVKLFWPSHYDALRDAKKLTKNSNRIYSTFPHVSYRNCFSVKELFDIFDELRTTGCSSVESVSQPRCNARASNKVNQVHIHRRRARDDSASIKDSVELLRNKNLCILLYILNNDNIAHMHRDFKSVMRSWKNINPNPQWNYVDVVPGN